MSRRILLVSLAMQLFTLGNAHAQYVYIKHPEVLVKQGATTAVLPANPLRAFVYCVIASPRKSEPLALGRDNGRRYNRRGCILSR
jgi:hypothetical protein